MKNVCKLLGIIALVALISFSMAACDDGSGGTGGGGTGGGNSSNWPPNSVLSQWGLSGMPVPTGATNIDWYNSPNSTLSIDFDGTSASDAAVDRWLTNNGWTLDRDRVYDDWKAYTKSPFFLSYDWGEMKWHTRQILVGYDS